MIAMGWNTHYVYSETSTLPLPNEGKNKMANTIQPMAMVIN
jgi:hypothetical protein